MVEVGYGVCVFVGLGVLVSTANFVGVRVNVRVGIAVSVLVE